MEKLRHEVISSFRRRMHGLVKKCFSFTVEIGPFKMSDSERTITVYTTRMCATKSARLFRERRMRPSQRTCWLIRSPPPRAFSHTVSTTNMKYTEAPDATEPKNLPARAPVELRDELRAKPAQPSFFVEKQQSVQQHPLNFRK